MTERLPILSILVALLLPLLALGQQGEPVPYGPRPGGIARAEGERIVYVYDTSGALQGCLSQAVSRVPNPLVPLSATECTQSRARARAQLADAIDGGALDP